MMFTGRAKVAAVGVFVATVSVLGLCFAAVWAGDYRQLNESKSAEISQPYEAQPAIHPQFDEKEEVSMRKTVLDIRGAIPEAIVELNARLDNVVLPTSEIQQLTNDDKEGLDEANKGFMVQTPKTNQQPQQPLQLPAAATGGKKLDKAHRICLNTQLNELDATYETSLVDYKDKKGPDFVVGPVTQFSTAYANADTDQSLADADFLKVAAAKANFDGLFFYLKTSHTIEICDFTADDANKEAVKANPVLFNLPESQCAKAISAADDFETGAGIKLLSECKTSQM